MKKKKPFLLLEVLIALLIVALCIVPLVQTPIRGYQSGVRLLEEMERQRLADWTFSEVKEKLLRHEIPWKKIPEPTKKQGPFPLPPATISIPGSPPKTIQRSFYLYCVEKGEKEGSRGEISRLLHISLEFSPRLPLPKKKRESYLFPLLVRWLPDENGKPSTSSSSPHKIDQTAPPPSSR